MKFHINSNINKLINKKYIFVIDRGDKYKPIIIKFQDYQFFHLVGLHKIKIENYFPKSIKARDERYKYIIKNIIKFNTILENQSKKNNRITTRFTTFKNVLDLLNSSSTTLYDLKEKNPYSKYDGDYGLLKMYENDLLCLLGLKEDEITDKEIKCNPNSWMSSKTRNILIENKRPRYIKQIYSVSINKNYIE